MVLKSPPYFSFSALQRIRRPREIADTTPQSFIIFTQYTPSIKINGREGDESNYRGPPLCVKNCRSNSFSSRRLEPKRCCTTYEPNWFQALHKKSPYYYYHDVIKTSEGADSHTGTGGIKKSAAAAATALSLRRKIDSLVLPPLKNLTHQFDSKEQGQRH